MEKVKNLELKDENGKTALIHAIRTRKEPVALALIERGVSLDIQAHDGKTALHWAVISENITIFRALMEKGADSSLKDELGQSPLKITLDKKREKIKAYDEIIASIKKIDRRLLNNDNDLIRAIKGHALNQECIQLIDTVENLDELDNHGQTALMLAISGHRVEVASALIKKSKNVNKQSKHGGTALQWAAIRGYEDLVSALIEKGADLDLRDAFSKTTALLYAINNERKEAALVLIKAGANVSFKDRWGKSPLEAAKALSQRRKGFEEVVEAIKNRDMNVTHGEIKKEKVTMPNGSKTSRFFKSSGQTAQLPPKKDDTSLASNFSMSNVINLYGWQA